MANVLTLGPVGGAGAIDLLSSSFQTNRLPDEPNFGVNLRIRQNAPAGTHQGILSYAERTSVTLSFSVRCLGNAGAPSLQASRANRDAIRTMLDNAAAYWLSPGHVAGTLTIVTYQFGDMASADTWTVFRGEVREQHGIDAAVGYISLGLKLFTWEGTVS